MYTLSVRFYSGKERSMSTIKIDPLTRIEGHLRIDTRVENGRVVEAWSRGEMFRGFEALLVGRDPLDAPVITQRICGVCPVSHAVASCKALERALGLVMPANGDLLRNLVLGANYLQSHILHFYQLSALDFVNVEDLLGYSGNDAVLRELKAWAGSEVASNRVLPVAPFLPKLPGDYPADAQWNLGALAHYVEALEIRQEAHRMTALFGGKMPHTATLIPGGVTCGVDAATVENFRMRLRRVKRFIENIYLPDVLAAARLFPAYAGIGRGVSNFLSFGVFDESGSTWLPAGVLIDGRLESLDTSQISETVAASYYDQSGALHPTRGEIRPHPEKAGAYSWLKGPRYRGLACEVGPLARILVAVAAGSTPIGTAVGDLLKETGLTAEALPSALGRHAARALEALLVAQRMENWLDRLQPGAPSVAAYASREQGEGEGLTEAPRGALGHWIHIDGGKIDRYQCVVPSTWNFSPRGDQGEPGPVEAALLDTPVNLDYHGLEMARVVRSFDPCIACAVH
jgi:ferredoxin hydrogenase large subunit/hydrogenase large subunit